MSILMRYRPVVTPLGLKSWGYDSPHPVLPSLFSSPVPGTQPRPFSLLHATTLPPCSHPGLGARGGHCMDQAPVFLHANVGLHTQEPLVPLRRACLAPSPPCDSWWRVEPEGWWHPPPCPLSIRPCSLQRSLTATNIFSPNGCFSRKWRMQPTSINSFSMAASLRDYQFCIR